MRRAPHLGCLALVALLLVVVAQAPQRLGPVWDEQFRLPQRARQSYNPRRNRERWARRQARWERQHRAALRAARRRCRAEIVRLLLKPKSGAVWQAAALGTTRNPPPPPALSHPPASEPPNSAVAPRSDGGGPGRPPGERPPPPTPPAPDPLADLRQRRGWIDHLPRPRLWAMLVRVRWPHGPQCPHCGETDPRYLKLIDPDYRDGLGRWQCRVCAEAGDPGQAGTFMPLTGTLLDGMRVDVRALWMIVKALADGQASLETAKETRVNRHTTDRLFRLLRAALYQARSTDLLVLGPEDVGELDEVYLTAGLKGNAGGRELGRAPRKRGLKRRGRGTGDSDRLPVLGLLCRGGQVRLFVLRNVQTETIRPIVQQMIQRGAKVYTDRYAIYHFLDREGYQHRTVNHGAGEYALDPDRDGRCEVHCHTLECTWPWLRPMVRTYRGVSKVYLPLYVAHFEFLFNHRHENRWNRTLDVLHVAFQVDAAQVADLLHTVEGAHFAEVCPVAG